MSKAHLKRLLDFDPSWAKLIPWHYPVVHASTGSSQVLSDNLLFLLGTSHSFFLVCFSSILKFRLLMDARLETSNFVLGGSLSFPYWSCPVLPSCLGDKKAKSSSYPWVSIYISNSQQPAIKEHHNAHQHEEEAKRGQPDTDFYMDVNLLDMVIQKAVLVLCLCWYLYVTLSIWEPHGFVSDWMWMN